MGKVTAFFIAFLLIFFLVSKCVAADDNSIMHLDPLSWNSNPEFKWFGVSTKLNQLPHGVVIMRRLGYGESMVFIPCMEIDGQILKPMKDCPLMCSENNNDDD